MLLLITAFGKFYFAWHMRLHFTVRAGFLSFSQARVSTYLKLCHFHLQPAINWLLGTSFGKMELHAWERRKNAVFHFFCVLVVFALIPSINWLFG